MVVLIIGGIKFLTSAGEAKAIQAATQSITWALLGILFLAIAWLILQLIQNFTGVEVTKFSLSSLPGVQGFTGSSWESPPATSTSNPAAQATKPQPTPTNITPVPVRIMIISGCEDANEVFDKVETVDFFDPRNTAWGATSVYTDADNIIELANVLPEPRWIFLMIGMLDKNIYALNQTFYNNLVVNFPWIPPRLARAYGRFEKDKYPTKFMEAMSTAKGIAIEIESRLGGFGRVPIEPNDTVNKITCPDADYYSLAVLSPLIYLYPQKPVVASIKIRSLIISPKLFLNNNSWHLVAVPDGTLTTQDGRKSRFIPYEFLRSDFKRPEKGFVIEESRLEEYLKTDLWKKLGLTDSEINDYWLDVKPRIKSSPYYFISLIDRSEIDRVLPMEVNPKPDTILRNMTYILPLPSKPQITPQPLELTSPKRNGFTVLENGVFTDGF